MTGRSDRVARPIFLIGMGRSGSTVVFECLASHRDLGWFAHHANRAPAQCWRYGLSRVCDVLPTSRKAIERSDQRRSWLEKLRIGPAEAYETWDHLVGDKLRASWLIGERADDAERERVHAYVADVLRWCGKPRFAAKLTGPPRIEYLASLFPDASFVHVMRDGRAVATSLLRVGFWRDGPRMEEPAWRGGPPEAYLALWRELDRSPLALAALQWRFAIETARREAAALEPGRYQELRYEAFLDDPAATLADLLRRCELPPCSRVERFLGARFEVRDRNASARARLSPQDKEILERTIGPTLRELGYAVEATPSSSS